MANQRRCWDCDYFDLITGLVGLCRRYAPSGIAESTVPGMDVSGRDNQLVFPEIIDGKMSNCGDFKPTSRTPLP